MARLQRVLWSHAMVSCSPSRSRAGLKCGLRQLVLGSRRLPFRQTVRPSRTSVLPSDPRSRRSGRCSSTGAGSRHSAFLAAHRLGLPIARRFTSLAGFAARSARTSGALVPRVAERCASRAVTTHSTPTRRYPLMGGYLHSRQASASQVLRRIVRMTLATRKTNGFPKLPVETRRQLPSHVVS